MAPEVGAGLKMPVEDPSVRAKGDNRQMEGKSKIIQQDLSRSRLLIPLLQG